MQNYLPLSRAFNVAVQHIAQRLMPAGYDVSPTAPETWEALQADVARRGRITVFDGASNATIYADPETNYAFRAWHDWCHLAGGFDFTLQGELATCEMQKQHVRELYGHDERADLFCGLIDAEVAGQAALFTLSGSFPTDQREFDAKWLSTPAHIRKAIVEGAATLARLRSN